MPQLAPGLQVTANLRLVRPLGRGGMGSVWLAQNSALSSQVAVKFLADELATDALSISRFTREAATASQVKSPHVVQVFDHGIMPDGTPYLVMELLEGESLAARLENGPLPPRAVATLVSQLAKALQKAHEKGIVHRDIKPDNIFLVDDDDRDLFCKLLDFGIAKGARIPQGPALKTGTGSLVGTPHYMSPEQAVGSKDLDHRSDLWSLGMVAFEALTARRALDAESLGALVLAIHTADLPRPSDYNPSLPHDIDRWFSVACARRPADRFQSAREMAEALWMASGELAHRTADRERRPQPAVDPLAQTAHGPSPLPSPERSPLPRIGRPRAEAATIPDAPAPTAPTQLAPRPDRQAPAQQPTAQQPTAQQPAPPPSLIPPPVSARSREKAPPQLDDVVDRSNNLELAVHPARGRPLPRVNVRTPSERSPMGIILIGLCGAVILLTGSQIYSRGRDVLTLLFPDKPEQLPPEPPLPPVPQLPSASASQSARAPARPPPRKAPPKASAAPPAATSSQPAAARSN